MFACQLLGYMHDLTLVVIFNDGVNYKSFSSWGEKVFNISIFYALASLYWQAWIGDLLKSSIL